MVTHHEADRQESPRNLVDLLSGNVGGGWVRHEGALSQRLPRKWSSFRPMTAETRM